MGLNLSNFFMNQNKKNFEKGIEEKLTKYKESKVRLVVVDMESYCEHVLIFLSTMIDSLLLGFQENQIRGHSSIILDMYLDLYEHARKSYSEEKKKNQQRDQLIPVKTNSNSSESRKTMSDIMEQHDSNCSEFIPGPNDSPSIIYASRPEMKELIQQLTDWRQQYKSEKPVEDEANWLWNNWYEGKVQLGYLSQTDAFVLLQCSFSKLLLAK